MVRDLNPEALPRIDHQVYPPLLTNYPGDGPPVSIPRAGGEGLHGNDDIFRVYGDVMGSRGGELLRDPNPDLSRIEIGAVRRGLYGTTKKIMHGGGNQSPLKEGKDMMGETICL